MKTIGERVAEMQSPLPGAKYYAITLTATVDGRLYWESQSGFAGMSETTPQRELRAPCVVIPDRMQTVWRQLGQPSVVVNDDRDFTVFMLIGGNAVVRADVAERRLAFLLKPSPSAPDGPYGRITLCDVPTEELNRAPTPKKRMAVLKRDDYRCQVCGRRATDYVDVELNVHHVRPWEQGGLTKPNNLLTLCRTCHKGLDPHSEFTLFALVKTPGECYPAPELMRKRLFEGIRRYRLMIHDLVKERRQLPERKANQGGARYGSQARRPRPLTLGQGARQ
jgi:hypothetical protein